MDFDSLSIVTFGDRDSLGEFLFANAVQHQVFRETLFRQGNTVPALPLDEADFDNLDDWLQAHQEEHQQMAILLGLQNPFNMFDTDWNKEEDFYDWLSTHYTVHTQIAAALGLT